MPDGEMRRPPQLWEQRLSRLTSVLGVGLSSSDTTSIVAPEPPPGTGGGTEPAPVLPAPGAFIKPSTPTLLGQVQGISVLWDGLNSASELWPYDTSYIEVHMDTSGTAFTPGSATLKGRLDRPGAFYVGGLTAGSTYYFRLRGADPAGNVTDPSDAASGLTGLTTSGDYGTATIGSGAVSFDARTIGGVTNTVGSVEPSNPIQGDVWLDSSPGTAIIHKIYNGSSWVTNAWGSASIAAGQISALQIAAGAVTAGAIAAGAVTTDKLTAGTISGFYISGGTIAGGYISGGTMNAGYISGGTMNAGYISGGTMNAGYISGGTMNAGYISGGTVDAGYINGGTVNAAVYTGGSISSSTFTGGTIAGNIAATGTISSPFINGGTVEGARFQTSAGGSRIRIDDDVVGPFGTADAIEFVNSGTSKGLISYVGASDSLDFYADEFIFVKRNGTTGVVAVIDGEVVVSDITASGTILMGFSNGDRAFRVAGDGTIYSNGIDDNTTANAANVRVGSSAQLLKSTSTERVKTDIIPLGGDLEGVDPAKISSDLANVNTYDVLAITPAEFQSLAPVDADQRILGFIAENVAEVFPWAAEWDEVGEPSSVADRPIVAALLAVVKDQQTAIMELDARVAALEA